MAPDGQSRIFQVQVSLSLVYRYELWNIQMGQTRPTKEFVKGKDVPRAGGRISGFALARIGSWVQGLRTLC